MEGISLFDKKNVLIVPKNETIKSGFKYSIIDKSLVRSGKYFTDMDLTANVMFIRTKTKYFERLGQEQESSNLVITSEGVIFFLY